MIRAFGIINNPCYKNVMCSVSGGADSDLLADICSKCDNDKKVKYVWFDTGLEYQATKDHLNDIQEKYGIEITKYKPKKPIPLTCKESGQPFINKQVSNMISRLQHHNFKFAQSEGGGRPHEELVKEYPNCKSALNWWCNKNNSVALNIERNRFLREFMLNDPPTFKISSLCCDHAKKDVSHKAIKDFNADLDIIGIRRAEKGIRASVYKSCFGERGGTNLYMPLFWYNDGDRKEYSEHMDIIHSKCYTEYGLTRTGCAGCPFGRDFENELNVIEKYEPRLYKAVNNIFGDSYAYTRKFREYAAHMNSIYKSYPNYKKIMGEKSNGIP